jgi:hypothetical protein
VRVGQRVRRNSRTGTVIAVHPSVGMVTVRWDDGKPEERNGYESLPERVLRPEGT